MVFFSPLGVFLCFWGIFLFFARQREKNFGVNFLDPTTPKRATKTGNSRSVLDGKPTSADDGAFLEWRTFCYNSPHTTHQGKFLGTIWNGLLNGSPRVNQTDTSAPRGQRSTGYVWSVAINGWRRTLAQTLLDEQQRIAEQHNRNRTTRTTAGAAIFGADAPNATLLEISWYVAAIVTHAPRGWFTLLSNAWKWKSAVETSGDTAQVPMSYERGERKENGHIQGIARILTHISLKERIRRWMRASLMVGQGAYRAKIGLVFFTGQDWTHMGGYVQKDHGLPHYLFYYFPQLPDGAFLSCCLS